VYERLAQLFVEFTQLSLLAIGGASATLAELRRYLVDTHGWMSNEQFYALYAISQAAPGPNVQFVVLFGWQVAGVPGAAVSLLGMCGPSGLLALLFEALAGQRRHDRWPGLLRRGLAPLSIGLLLSNGWLLAKNIDVSWAPLMLTVLAVFASLKLRVHPLYLIGVGAIGGIIGF
jgi:chromate transporter